MSHSDIIESMDSLWFFSNVVSSPRTAQDAVKEEAPNPKNPVEEEKQNEPPTPENFVPNCPKCGELCNGEEKEFAKPAAEEKRKRRRSSSKRRRRQGRSKRSSRKVLGELDHLHLGFDYGNYMDFWLFDDEEIITGGQNKQVLGSGSEYHHPVNMKMPPLDDNMAMKEHLKSWAYAVASTVR